MAKFKVVVLCKVRKLLYLEGCDEEAAWNQPFDFANNEEEIDQVDWDVQRVEEVNE